MFGHHFAKATMEECLHGKHASSSTTKKGTFWFCGQKPSCEFFCPDQDCYMYTKAMATFRENGCIHPVCPAHQRYAKLCVVKDKMKQSYGRPFFVCSERENPCKFWQWGDIFESQNRCAYTAWCVVNEKSRKMVGIRIVYFTAIRESTLVISSRGKQQEPRVVNTGIMLFSNPPQYR